MLRHRHLDQNKHHLLINCHPLISTEPQNAALIRNLTIISPELAFTCSKLTTETLEQGVKYVNNMLTTLAIF